ncbi:vertebrate transmembrane 4 superfamily-like, partial [Scleropages formosus]
QFIPYKCCPGAALAYVGSYVLKSYTNFGDFLEDKYTLIPAAIIIGVAVVMFVIGTLGCCATLKESKVGLGLFLLILLVIFTAEVTAFVFGFIYRGKGCENKLVQLLQDVISYAMLVILGFAIIKFFGMLSVCVITCRKRRNNYHPLLA